MLDGLGASTAYAVALREGDKLKARFEAQRSNSADIARFREAATKHRDVESLLKDRRTLQVVLEAFQLESEINKTGILRKILTQDPSEPGSLANRLTDQRWRQLAAAFADRQTVSLTTTQVAAMTTTQSRALTLNQMAGLTSAQLGALTTTQVAAFDPAQIRAISSADIRALETADMVALSSAQVAAFRPSQLSSMSFAQIAAIETGDLAGLGTAQMRSLGFNQLVGLTTGQMRALTTTQLHALTTTQIASLGTRQLAALSSTQVAALGTSQAAALAANRLTVPAEAERAPLDDRALVERLVSQTLTNRYEKSMGSSNAGMREALYFTRQAASITSINGLMSDSALTAVVRGALGLNDSFAALGFDQQKSILTRRVNLADFQDPRAVQKMAARYLTLKGATTSSATSAVMALFAGSDASSLASLAATRLSFTA